MELLKKCTKCGAEKSHSNFKKSSKGDRFGLHSWCHDCNRQARREHRKKNPEKYYQWHKDWCENNPDKVAGYEQNRIYTYTYQDWISLPGRRDAKRAYDSNYRATKSLAQGSLTKAIVDSVFEKYGKLCLQCGSTENIEIDHIVPLTKGGSNLFENLQPLCKTHNSSKGNRSSTDYRQGDGRTTA